MNDIIYEVYCPDCDHSEEMDEKVFTCPHCDSNNIFVSRHLICDCGEKVYLTTNTNECDECGCLYNAFGQQLADPSEWDLQDYYDTFVVSEDIDGWY